MTLGGEATAAPMLSVASESGSGTELAALTIEVDDLDATLARVQAERCEIEYGPVTEPWGVRRFYLRDPLGTLLNVLTHQETSP